MALPGSSGPTGPAAPSQAPNALTGPDDILRYDYDGLVAEFARRFGKGEYHAGALFRALYRRGESDPGALPEFAANPSLAQAVRESFRYRLPPESGRSGEGEAGSRDATYKFLLRLPGGLESESVVIPMRQYKSLCISSQVGCKMGCAFCETAQMGYLRSLDAGEIVAQVMFARHVLKEPIENVVFMGMGEPMDNLDNVLQAVRILSDQRGLDIAQSAITISTVGHVDGIDRLARLAAEPLPHGFPRLRLAVSLNAPNDAIRSRIMPVNRQWPLAELKRALRDFPLARKGDFLFMEYVLLAGVNDSREHALEVAEYLRDLKACVNLIPYNPRLDSPFGRPEKDGVARFYHWLMEAGQYCRIRGTKGMDAMAACGQLGNRALRRGGARPFSDPRLRATG
ncbi:MAG TPA: 23S rRNA (adenine(2503)-C(2))-methyltransferase RlmN [Fibrobacteria bacterium]|nr:23S rRNA (adenine(2503)-C(2))-methyltransferase RlmN [Fibrobacteria bacterium]